MPGKVITFRARDPKTGRPKMVTLRRKPKQGTEASRLKKVNPVLRRRAVISKQVAAEFKKKGRPIVFAKGSAYISEVNRRAGKKTTARHRKARK